MGRVFGVLEHLLFLLHEKNLQYTLEVLEPPAMEDITILLTIKKHNFIYIIKKKKRISYYLKTKSEEKRNTISKSSLIEFIKEF